MRKIAILSAIALVLVGCFNPWQGDTGSLSISIGSGNGRTLLANDGFANDDGIPPIHKVKITDSSGREQFGEIRKDGGIASFSSLALGPCEIEVKGFLNEDDIENGNYVSINLDPKTITIKAGVNTVEITMTFDVEGGGETDIDIDFGSDPIEDTFYVPETGDWERAVEAIKNGGSGKNYIISVTGSQVDIPGYNTNTFDNITNIKVSIRGAGNTLVLKETGSILRIGANQTVILRDVTLQGKGRDSSNNASLVYVANEGTLIMRGEVSITSNNGIIHNSGYKVDNEEGGGVYVSGTFDMYDGEISSNNARKGGGVYVASGGIFNMYDGRISANIYNDFPEEGGGVYVKSGGRFTMENGEISGNKVKYNGGGVYVAGTFTMNGGIINDNSTNGLLDEGFNDGGGGVYVYINGDFTMNNSDNPPPEIFKNTAKRNGGGVMCMGGTFTMKGGTISNNTAGDSSTLGYGGGVNVNGYWDGENLSGIFTMNSTNAKILGNKAFTSGGGVYVNGTFNIANGTIYGESESTGIANILQDTSKNTEHGSTLFNSATINTGTGNDNNWVIYNGFDGAYRGYSQTLIAIGGNWTGK